ncbi:MAG: GGDEF domain-containing protein, partial [candidate division WOR-3 bacterium]
MNFEIYIDELTELKNRRYLLEKGEEILKNWKEGTFIIFDLDNFKEINDKFGHLKGDEVLKGISKILYAVFEGENNEVLRYAGDEFIIITKIKDRSTIEEKSKKLLETIRNYPYGIDYGLGKINLGASMGISNFPEDGFSIQELF